MIAGQRIVMDNFHEESSLENFHKESFLENYYRDSMKVFGWSITMTQMMNMITGLRICYHNN